METLMRRLLLCISLIVCSPAWALTATAAVTNLDFSSVDVDGGAAPVGELGVTSHWFASVFNPADGSSVFTECWDSCNAPSPWGTALTSEVGVRASSTIDVQRVSASGSATAANSWFLASADRQGFDGNPFNVAVAPHSRLTISGEVSLQLELTPGDTGSAFVVVGALNELLSRSLDTSGYSSETLSFSTTNDTDEVVWHTLWLSAKVSGHTGLDVVTPVPEPSGGALISVGLAALFACRLCRGDRGAEPGSRLV
jgi:hypothetical protein